MYKAIFAILCLTAFSLSISCKKETAGNNTIVNPPPPPTGNISPVSRAGRGQVINLPLDSINVDGSSSSDPDGTIGSYLWTKISGPSSYKIVNPDSAKTVINQLVPGKYQFELNVKDNGGLYAKDTIEIIVNPTSSGNSSVWFWTRDIVWNNIYININNETKVLDEGWGGNGDPSCYPNGGSIDFNLPSGTYTYKTWRQGRDTITGAVTVNFGVCNSVQIIY